MSWDRAWKDPLDGLAALRGPGMQVAQYLAVLSGIRRSLDDWVPAPQFSDYSSLVSRLGLRLEIDCAFLPISRPERVLGLEHAPTTRFEGQPYSKTVQSNPHASLHVAVSSRADWAADALAASWYPLVVEERVTYKPRVDFLRQGRAYGYPECCVRFFMDHNDWPRQNTMAEAAKRTSRFHWKANCIPKNTPRMLIFHMPCRFDCPKTLEYSAALLEVIEAYDGVLAAEIESSLRQTFLASSERLCHRLINAVTTGPDRARYAGAESLHRHTSLRDAQDARYDEALAAGDELRIEDGVVHILRDGKLKDMIATRCDRGVAEVPLLLSFGER